MINFSGLSSGLDTSSIIDAMVAAQRVPIQRLNTRKGGLETQISRMGEIANKLGSLQTMASDMATVGDVLASDATSSDEGVLGATTDGATPAGVYEVTVTETARAEKNRSAAFGGKFSPVKAGTLTLEAAGQDAVEFEIVEGDTLATVVDKINASGARADAALLYDGSSYHLQITARDAGHAIGGAPDDALVITESYAGAEGAELGMTQTVQARNAIVDIDGLTVESRSNTLTDAIEGVTLNLQGEGASTLTVASDREGTKENVQALVDQLNEVMDFVKDQVRTRDGAQAVGADPALRQLVTTLRGAFTSPMSGADGAFNALSQIGVRTDATGALSLDAEAFDAALDTNPQAVAAMFVDDSDGLSSRLSAIAERYLDGSDGVLAGRRKSLERRIGGYDDQIGRLEDRLDTMRTSMQRRFAALETTMSQIQSQGSALNALLPSGGLI